jgi:hypothetical protein
MKNNYCCRIALFRRLRQLCASFAFLGAVASDFCFSRTGTEANSLAETLSTESSRHQADYCLDLKKFFIDDDDEYVSFIVLLRC